MRLLQSLAEETSGGSCIPLGREQKVDRLPEGIDGTVQIDPFAFHLDVCLVDPPGSICHLEMRTDALVQLGCISLNPTKEGRVIHRDATIGEHALEIAIADGELQIPADRPQNDLRRELSTLERVLASLLHRQPLFTPSLHSWGRRSLKAATEPGADRFGERHAQSDFCVPQAAIRVATLQPKFPIRRSMEQCVLMSGSGLGRQDRTPGKVPHGVSQPAPMRSPCFATVTSEGAVLDAAPRDIEPLLVNEHLRPFRYQTVRHRAAVAIMTAGQT
jgi:hypothetical protein